jgi:hypothetical protein
MRVVAETGAVESCPLAFFSRIRGVSRRLQPPSSSGVIDVYRSHYTGRRLARGSYGVQFGIQAAFAGAAGTGASGIRLLGVYLWFRPISKVERGSAHQIRRELRYGLYGEENYRGKSGEVEDMLEETLGGNRIRVSEHGLYI